MSVLNLHTNGRELLLTEPTILTSGSMGADTIHIELDDSWNYDDANYYFSYEGVGNNIKGKRELNHNSNELSCLVPDIITKNPGEWKVGIYEEWYEGYVKTSTVLKIEISQGAKPDVERDQHDVNAIALEIIFNAVLETIQSTVDKGYGIFCADAILYAENYAEKLREDLIPRWQMFTFQLDSVSDTIEQLSTDRNVILATMQNLYSGGTVNA